ncbi:MAG: RNA polymerase factor sigma-32 [Rhodospirillales bacterium]|nr:RNA polymerase factor sigma-32 [Rhodospirillales bacterium]
MAHIDDPRTQRANLDYIRSAMKAPMLERDFERDLAVRWRENGDEKALHALVTPHARLVISIASRFRHYGLPIGDLVQEGNVGLMQAASRFDPEREVRFSTYATWWIRSTIQDYILRNWSIVRTGTTAAQKSLFFNLRRLRAKIEGRDGVLTDEGRREIAADLNVPLADVEAMEGRLSGNDRSLNVRISAEGEEEWQSFLADERPNPEDIVIGMRDSRTRSKWLAEALGDLSDRERTIIRKRHLAEGPVTLEDLGHQMGISKERVRQIETRAMDKLKTSLGHHMTEDRAAFF